MCVGTAGPAPMRERDAGPRGRGGSMRTGGGCAARGRGAKAKTGGQCGAPFRDAPARRHRAANAVQEPLSR